MREEPEVTVSRDIRNRLWEIAILLPDGFHACRVLAGDKGQFSFETYIFEKHVDQRTQEYVGELPL